jgi:hypothetical protein
MNITTFTVRFQSLEIFNTIPGRFNQNQSRNHIKIFYSAITLHLYVLDLIHIVDKS